MQDLRTESRDAVIYDIDLDHKLARVLIQSSDKKILARWPQNWEQTPNYLKPGNTVRMTFPAGNHGLPQITGMGFHTPTAVSGSSVPVPAPGQGDGVLSGGLVSATTPTASMYVVVGTAIYRIDGMLYTLSGASIPLGNGMPLGSGAPLGGASAVLLIAPASATQFRYDIVVTGTDSIPHVVQGTPADANPVMPETPVDHVKLQHILVHPGMTAVESNDIGAYYTTPTASTIGIALGADRLHGYLAGEPHIERTTGITVSVRDQYGNLATKASPGFAVTFEFFKGNGAITIAGTAIAFDESSGVQTLYTTTGQLPMTYTRRGTYSEQTPPDPPEDGYNGNGESSPVFRATVRADYTMLETMTPVLQLLDKTDTVVMGAGW
jgi:hypothetical protein